jgi:hypothetical protein
MADNNITMFSSKSGKSISIANSPEMIDAAKKQGWVLGAERQKQLSAMPQPSAPQPIEDMTEHGLNEYGTSMLKGIGGAASNLIGMPKALATPHASWNVTEEQERDQMGPITRSLYNITGDPLQSLAESKKARERSAAQGGGFADQAMSWLEENPMIGPFIKGFESAGPAGPLSSGRISAFNPKSLQSVTEAAAMKPLAELGGKLVTKTIPDKAANILQDRAGAGREPILRAKQRRADQITAVDKAFAERQETIKQQIKDRAVAKAERATAGAAKTKTDIEAKLKSQVDAKEHNNLLTEQRQRLTNAREDASKAIVSHLDTVEKAEHKSQSLQWDALRGIIDNSPVNPGVTYDVLNKARAELVGDPPNLKLFNDLTKQLSEPDSIAGAGVHNVSGENVRVPKETIPFDEARIHWQSLNRTLTNSNLPHHVKAAVQDVATALDKDIRDVVVSKGGPEGNAFYTMLKDQWADYCRTWMDETPLSKGGSPLAFILKLTRSQLATKDMMPTFSSAADRMLNKTGRERIPHLLSRKTQFGAQPELFTQLVDVEDALKRAMSTKTKLIPELTTTEQRLWADLNRPGMDPVKAEAGHINDLAGQIGQVSMMQFAMEQMKNEAAGTKQAKYPPPVDPVKLRRDLLLQRSGRPVNVMEQIMFPLHIEHLLLKSPMIREWLAKHPRTELPIPPE